VKPRQSSSGPLLEDKRANPTSYALVVLGEGCRLRSGRYPHGLVTPTGRLALTDDGRAETAGAVAGTYEAAVLTQQDAGEGATMEADAFGPNISWLLLLHLIWIAVGLFVGACIGAWRYYRWR
jgi:hypothetical protein